MAPVVDDESVGRALTPAHRAAARLPRGRAFAVIVLHATTTAQADGPEDDAPRPAALPPTVCGSGNRYYRNVYSSERIIDACWLATPSSAILVWTSTVSLLRFAVATAKSVSPITLAAAVNPVCWL